MNNKNLQNFFDGMAAQFGAGKKIIEPLNCKQFKAAYKEAINSIDRDINSFVCEAQKAFPAEFKSNDFLVKVMDSSQ